MTNRVQVRMTYSLTSGESVTTIVGFDEEIDDIEAYADSIREEVQEAFPRFVAIGNLVLSTASIQAIEVDLY